MAQPRRGAVYVSLQDLDPLHYRVLVHAIQNVLSTEIAELTLAELTDGLPLWRTNYETRGGMLLRGSHPLASHQNLCDGALENAKEFRDAFDPSVLVFDSNVIQAYQDAQPQSHPFHLRLTELVALSVHQIGVILFKQESKVHDGDIDSVVSFKEPSKWVTLYGLTFYDEELYDPWPTLFFHADFMEHEHYPNGLADTVGYWTEDRILGGVARFDRGISGLEGKDIYFQSGRVNSTFRTWQLLPDQVAALVEFFLAEQPASTSPLPIMVSDKNRHRHDPWYAIPNHIYRDAWELDLPAIPVPDPRYERDVRSTGDYPELEAVFEMLNADASPVIPYRESRYTSLPPSPQVDLAERSPPGGETLAQTSSEVQDSEAIVHSGDADDSDANSLFELVHGTATSPNAMCKGEYVFTESERQMMEDFALQLDSPECYALDELSDERGTTPQRRISTATLDGVALQGDSMAKDGAQSSSMGEFPDQQGPTT